MIARRSRSSIWKRGRSMSEAPVIGITMGDAAGIGPELCLQLLANRTLQQDVRLQVYGSLSLLQRVADACGLPPPPSHQVVDVAQLDASTVHAGTVQAACGAAAARCVEAAVAAALAHTIAAVVTAPVHKESLCAAGVPFPGHTEMLAHLTDTPVYCMMMASEAMSVCLVTTHIPLQEVSRGISVGRVQDVIQLAVQAMQRMGVAEPRVTLCGVNPHAGEGGLFGREEEDILIPAVEAAKAAGVCVEGPLPPDTAFLDAVRARTDVYIAMYHDQGLIPFKMVAFETGVNVTLGLPIVRTSPDHGTAFDLAWQGTASVCSIEAAVQRARECVVFM